MEHPVLPAAVRGQCWEHGLLREREGIKASGGWAFESSRVESSLGGSCEVKLDQVGSSRDPGLKIAWGIFFEGLV